MEELKQVESGLSVPEIYRKLSISAATPYKWRAKSGGKVISIISSMKDLELEITRLKKKFTEEWLKAQILMDAVEGKVE